jgi:gliding motility-associated-like protein
LPATAGGAQYIAQAFPPTTANNNPINEIALMVGDYQVTSPNSITYFTSGTAPNRVAVVKFNALQSLSGAYSTTGELHLYEGSGIIDIMLQSSNYANTNHTTGIKQGTGVGVAAPGRNATPYTIPTSEGWRFTPQNGASATITNTVWSPNTSISNPNITNPLAYPSSTVTYVADVDITINRFTNPEVCRVRDSVTVRAGSFPHTVTATPSTVCFGTNSQLSFNSPNTVTNYTWTPAIALTDPSIANPVATVYDTTGFVVVATDNNGCTVRDSITVATYPYPHLTLGRDTSVCYTDSVRLSLGGSYTSFEWYTPGNPTPVSTAPVITALPTSSYVLRLQDSASLCYFYTDTITIDSFPHPLLHVTASGPLAFCVGGNVTLQTDQGYSNYNWSPSGGSGQAIPVTASGAYSYTATDGNNCHRYSDTANVSVAAKPVIALSPLTTICAGSPITVIASTTPAGVPVYWELNGATVYNGDTFTTTTPGTYEVVASQGCPDSTSVVLTTAQPPVVALDTPVRSCNCDPNIVLKPTVTSPTAVTYVWSNGTTDSTYTVDSVVNQLYTVTVTDANGCTATASEQVSITCFKVHAYVQPGDTVYVGQTFELLDSPQHAGPYIGYQWYPSDSLTSPNYPATKGTASGLQPIDTFYLAAIDTLSGCRDTSSVTVYVINHGGFRMPTAFTPNGDGKNETMYPVLAVGSQVTVFRVYNRWGQLVYDNPLPPGWTGNFGGNAQATDTYTYFVTVESPDPADAAKKVQKSVEGSFQLFR